MQHEFQWSARLHAGPSVASLFALITLRFIHAFPSNGYASANTLILQALTRV
jgi:hypothetical protein